MSTTIGDDLRAELCQVFVIGFLDVMAGTEVEDEDCIPAEMAAPLIQMAESCIDSAATMIASIYTENPTLVYQTVYQSGVEAGGLLRVLDGDITVNLN